MSVRGLELPSRRRRRPSGFSVVEIVLVLATIATLTAIVAPRYATASQSAALDAAARRVVAELEAIRERARASSSVATVQVSTLTSSIRVSGIPTERMLGAASGLILADPPYGVEVSSVSFGGGSTFTFDARGEPNTRGSITLRRGDATRTVSVVGSGAISWK